MRLYVTMQVSLEIERVREQLDDEAAKKQLQKEENARRKHNYIPFICKLIDTLGENDKLTKLMEAKPRSEQTAP
jgi:hypothetical protein